MIRARLLRWIASGLYALALRIERDRAPVTTIVANRNRRIFP